MPTETDAPGYRVVQAGYLQRTFTPGAREDARTFAESAAAGLEDTDSSGPAWILHTTESGRLFIDGVACGVVGASRAIFTPAGSLHESRLSDGMRACLDALQVARAGLVRQGFGRYSSACGSYLVRVESGGCDLYRFDRVRPIGHAPNLVGAALQVADLPTLPTPGARRRA